MKFHGAQYAVEKGKKGHGTGGALLTVSFWGFLVQTQGEVQKKTTNRIVLLKGRNDQVPVILPAQYPLYSILLAKAGRELENRTP